MNLYSSGLEKSSKGPEIIMSTETVSQGILDDIQPRLFNAYILKNEFSYWDLEGASKHE